MEGREVVEGAWRANEGGEGRLVMRGEQAAGDDIMSVPGTQLWHLLCHGTCHVIVAGGTSALHGLSCHPAILTATAAVSFV